MFVAKNLLTILAFRAAKASFRLRHGASLAPPRIFLVNGSPKSGTTWVRMILSAVPGYFPGAHFTGNYPLYRTALPGAVLHGHEVLTPGLEEVLHEKAIRVVCLMRDPRDQLVSNMFHMRRDPAHAFHRQILSLDDVEALQIVIEGAPGNPFPNLEDILLLTESWLAPGAPCRMLRYEDLLQRPTEKLAEVFEYLELPVDPAFLRALADYFRFERVTIGRNVWRQGRTRGTADPSSHFRKGIAGDWVNFFNDGHKEQVKKISGDRLVAWGYERDLNW